MEVEQVVAVTCKNCETVFEGKYCPNCAQKANTHRFTMKHFLHEAFHALTHTDRGVLFLLKEMFLRPGTVLKDYLAGKRKRYFNPITFFFVITAIQITVSTKLDFFGAFFESMQQLTESFAAQSGETVDTSSIQESGKTVAVITEYSRLANFIFIPLLSFLSWAFFLKSKYNYTENLILNIAIYGQTAVYFFVVAVIPFLLAPGLVVLWLMLYSFLMWAYTMYVYKQFFGHGWLKTLFRGSVLYILYTIAIQYVTQLMVLVLG